MFDVVKHWFWYDWVMLFLRLLISASIILTMVDVQGELTLPLWGAISWAIIAFSVPWFCLLLNFKYYLVTEMILSGGISVYLTHLFPDAYLTLLMPAFMIAANSAHKSYRWSAPMTILVVPIMISIVSRHNTLWVMIVHTGLAYAIGFAFHLLVVNHRQNEIIRDQNTVLEQYVSQIERVTILEERNRLSKDLHDTIGHSNTSIIMGLETLRLELPTTAGQDKLDSLLQLARKSIDEIRGYVHQMESPQDRLPLVESLQQLIEEFQVNSNINVRFRSFGEESVLPRQAEMTFYRCLQESLTNAVRHGQATEISVSLQFELRQTRLEVQDNGRGAEHLQEGFGLKAMKERAYNLQGQISVYSALGEGTIVTCTLPRQVEMPEEVIRLLLVDDQPFIRESLQTLLERQGDLHVVGIAEDGQQAVELCEQVHPQVVLMDLDMPVRDGISATQMIKQRWPDIRVLILTTFQDKQKALEVLQSGADGYLLKSMEPRELAETIRLVHRGGAIIAHDMSIKLFEDLEQFQKKPEAQFVETKTSDDYGLTTRELEILQMVAQGLRYKTIASKLYLSDGTVRNYASSVYLKLDVRNREEAVQKAVEIGLL
ncbi:histidine kinase [Paenibacillus macquariensis subsp. macquariensis]|uniref:DNA-binding response regulator, NarL/FixJ family, contains REC and HTH domains n=1 Tax=Paenibacillus macquariensis TaxID=948756 RepID=A0ABY1JU80_9BACL|nr:histidine kinase [Paenibacillus macquariensis subsp. macquariensis]SIQ79150.1 DNA-binding response regulator, NarL/FixJ family, contains REC and HTH domains [Paenibacillus macquariensis]